MHPAGVGQGPSRVERFRPVSPASLRGQHSSSLQCELQCTGARGARMGPRVKLEGSEQSQSKRWFLTVGCRMRFASALRRSRASGENSTDSPERLTVAVRLSSQVLSPLSNEASGTDRLQLAAPRLRRLRLVPMTPRTRSREGALTIR